MRSAHFMAWRSYDRGGQPAELSAFFYAVLERIREVEAVAERKLLEIYTRVRDGNLLEVAIVDWPHPHTLVLMLPPVKRSLIVWVAA